MSTETALLASMGISTLGTFMSSGAERQQGQDQQAIYNANADVYRQDAAAAKEQGGEEAMLIKERARKLMGAQIAAAGAGGGDLSGSTLAVISDSAFQSERDVQMTLRNANLKALSLRNKANLHDAYGEAAKRTGNIRAATTLMQGASNILPLYASYAQMGGGGAASTKLAGNQTAIKNYGGLSNVANTSYNSFMGP